MKNNRVLSTVLSLMLGMTTVISLPTCAGTNEEVQETPIGTVYLQFDNIKLDGESIASDGSYDMTWSIKDNDELVSAEKIGFYIDNVNDTAMGEYGKLKLEIDEIWLDGVRYEDELARKPVYMFRMDDVVVNGVYNINALLKNGATESFKAEDNIRVVFTITGTSEISIRSGNILGDKNKYESDFNNEITVNAGDTNCDGVIDMSDAVLIMQALANPNKYGVDGTEEIHLTEQGKINADIAGDGLTVGDAQSIQKILLGLADN